MTKNQGLTGIKEEAKGFVGRSPLFDTTKTGVYRIKFDIYCGENDVENNKYSVLRHCIAYRELAEKIRDMKKGDLVNCRGWLSKESLRDENNHFVLENGVLKTIERLILWSADIQDYEKVPAEQMSFDKKLVENAK